MSYLRIAPLALALLAAGSQARPLFGTGPLCRDAKGLAKPCPPGTRREPMRAGGERVRSVEQPAVAPASPARTAPVRPARRKLFGTGRLCRDAKGLAKPC